jgi:hypothetical protein
VAISEVGSDKSSRISPPRTAYKERSTTEAAVIIASCRLTEFYTHTEAVSGEVPGVGFGARCETFGSLVDVVRDRRCGPPTGFGAEGGRPVSW